MICPAYITDTRSQISATTPRLWVMKMIEVFFFFCRSFISSRICACIVTSRAVVGSSAIRSFGSQISAMAIMARWRMPPENSCGYWSIRFSALLMPTSSSISMARARACSLV